MRALDILLINQYFPPDTSATALVAADVAGALAAAGHKVTVLAGRPSYAPTERRRWRLLRHEVFGACRVERVGSTAFSRSAPAGRAANYMSFLALALARACTRRADVILAMTDPPLAVLAGVAGAAVRGGALVYNVRDLHPAMAIAAGLIRPGVLSTAWDAVHRGAMRRAARVLVLGDDMRERVIAAGVEPARVTVVRDGAAPVAATGEVPAAVRALTEGLRFTVMHAGNLGHAGAFDTLLEAARLVAPDGASFVFVGDGATGERVRRAAGTDGNVRWAPPVPPADVPALLSAGDLQVVTLRRGLEGLVVPSKLYPILACGRPVLAVAPRNSDVARIVLEHGCGWVADPDDPAAVAAAVRAAMADPAARSRAGERARAAFPRFTRDRWLEVLVRQVESTVAERGA